MKKRGPFPVRASLDFLDDLDGEAASIRRSYE